MAETNDRPQRCLLCQFAIRPGEGESTTHRTYDKETGELIREWVIWAHANTKRCAELKAANKEMKERAIRRKALRERLIARIAKANQPTGATGQ